MTKRLTTTQRKWLLSAHITFSAAWLGAAFCFLVLSIVAGTTRDGTLLLGAYVTVDLLDRILVRPLAVATVVTGILLSVLTQWGLFRFVWVIAKLVLPVLLIVSGVIVFGVIRAPGTIISAISSAGLRALQNPAYQSSQTLLLVYVVAEVVFVSASVAISVFKPGGLLRSPHTWRIRKGA